jgi:two-component system, NtrC family, response regulator GlrR
MAEVVTRSTKEDSPTATVLLDEEGRPFVPVQQFRLRVVAGPTQGRTHASRGQRVSIGTGQGADFILRDPTMSRFHCEIAAHEQRVVVRDLGSRNGTVVDGVAVEAAYLRDGAVLTLGRTQLQFSLGDEQVGVPLSTKERFGLLQGCSPAIRAAFATLEGAAGTDATVLLEGETGTGKDLAAQSLHAEGPRRDGPFVVVDCGAIPATMLEAELFGHERGAFTGAGAARPGAVETASGGTLFVDEVGELAPDLQPKLLRVLDTRTTQRLGSTRRVPVDVRFIVATNRDLKIEVNAHRFRSDLFFRLAVVQVTLPPLRRRPEDVPLLVEQFLAEQDAAASPLADELRRPETLAGLRSHSWPGNVRELRNYVERCLALGQRAPVLAGPRGSGMPSAEATQPLSVAREGWVRYFERCYLADLLRRHSNNITAAARAAGVERQHLHKLITRAGLKR